MKKIIALLLVVLTVLLCGCSMGDGRFDSERQVWAVFITRRQLH